MAANENGVKGMKNNRPRRVGALIMIAGMLTVFALTASGCGGGSLCCQKQGSTEIIIQNADQIATPAPSQVSEEGENR